MLIYDAAAAAADDDSVDDESSFIVAVGYAFLCFVINDNGLVVVFVFYDSGCDSIYC